MNENLERIQNQSVADTIEQMTAAARDPVCNFDAETFGRVQNGVCWGGVWTNWIQREFGHVFTVNEIEDEDAQARVLRLSGDFINNSESAIDSLRRGDLHIFNFYAKRCGMQLIPREFLDRELPYLGNDFTEAELAEYDKLAADIRAWEARTI